MKNTVSFIMLFLYACSACAQQPNAAPCTSPECSQFDFWTGNWDAVYNDTLHAANYITKEMGGCLVHEHFNDPNTKYIGESWSVYNTRTKKWQQTWVDNMGGYIALTGEYKDGKMMLFTEPYPGADGKRKQSRMVFREITANSFTWDWEDSFDEGRTWKMNWQIHYTRRK